MQKFYRNVKSLFSQLDFMTVRFQIEFLNFSCYNSSTGLSENAFSDMFLLLIYKNKQKIYIIKKKEGILQIHIFMHLRSSLFLYSLQHLLLDSFPMLLLHIQRPGSSANTCISQNALFYLPCFPLYKRHMFLNLLLIPIL